MPTHIKIIHASEFIKATAEGKLDFEESKRGLQAIASAAGPLADCEIMLDTRKTESRMSPSVTLRLFLRCFFGIDALTYTVSA